MSFLKYFSRLQYIDFLVSRKATGDLQTFAKKNRLSKRSLTYILKDMKEMGFPIRYDKQRKSYCYTVRGKLTDRLFIEDGEILSREELRKISTQDVNNLCFSETSIFEPCVNS